jgi:hypothetical protein
MTGARFPGRRTFRRLCWAAVLTVSLVGCETMVDALRDPAVQDVPVENMPLAAGLWITTDPEVAPYPVDIDIRTLSGDRIRHLAFPAGTVVRMDEGLSAGSVRLVGPGEACAFDVRLIAERHTDIVLSLGSAGDCSFAVAAVHAGDGGHPASGSVAATVTVQPWPDFLVAAVSLDDPPQPVPDSVPPDEGGLAQLMPLWAGRYEIQLLKDGAVLERQAIEIDGNPVSSLVTLTLDGVPD